MKTIFQNKWVALLLLIISFLLIYNPFTKFPFTFCIIVGFVLLITFLQDGDLKSLNFKSISLKELKIIVICYLLLEFCADFIFDPIINWLCNETADYSAFSHIKGNFQSYFEWLLKMWISAAIGEELLFRGFVFSQLKRLIGEKKIIIIILSAIIFCIPHLYQGIVGILSTFIFGIAFALIYMKFKNIWINIIVHGLIDTVFLTLSYLGMLDFYNFFK